MKPTHATDCALLWSWLEDAALPEDVAGALDRCLDELERYDRGMGRNYAEGEWEPLEVRRPITEAVQSALAKAGKADPLAPPPTFENRKLSVAELRDRADAAFSAMLDVAVSHPDQIKIAGDRYRAASDAWHRALMAKRGER